MKQGISATTGSAVRPVSQQDVLSPIRIGAVAQQPGPDLATIIYVGLALLLPVRLRELCCCAGLFYAQVVSEQDAQFEIQAAALPHYVDPEMHVCHIHTCTISYGELVQLLEWDRHLAAMATCDLRDLVAEHAAKSRHWVHAYAQSKAVEIAAKEEVSVATDSLFPHESIDAPADKWERSAKNSHQLVLVVGVHNLMRCDLLEPKSRFPLNAYRRFNA